MPKKQLKNGMEWWRMKTCEDCIHYHVCDIEAMRAIENIGAELCYNFIDESKFIELPCSIGDYCIYHDDLWYINNITYCCDGSFLLWISMSDKSPCCAEVSLSEVEFISKEEVEKKLEELNGNAKN